MENSIWGPYGAHMDVPRWVPDESLLQNPHRSHMGCPYRTHIITHLGPIWVPYSLLAGYQFGYMCNKFIKSFLERSIFNLKPNKIHVINLLEVEYRGVV